MTQEFQAKSAYAKADLHQSFLEMHCAKGGDIREFLANLCYKKEELAATGVHITDKEYKCTILRGIHSELAMFVSHILSSAQIVHGSTSINIDALINQICEEAEQLKTWRAKGQNNQGGKKDSPDEALAATSSEGGKKCRKGKCHNCGKPGHWARECRSPKKEKSESTSMPQAAQMPSSTPKPENKPVGSTNAIIAHDLEGDGFWMAKEAVMDADLVCLVGAEPVPVLGIADEANSMQHSEEEGDLAFEPQTVIEVGAIITQVNKGKDVRICTELYDSGATWHISPYKPDFLTYLPLTPPVFLNAANQQKFPAIGHGMLSVLVPHGAKETWLTLHHALHVLAVSYTLVSIGALDVEGYHAHIGSSSLELTSLQGERIGRILCTQGHLYKIMHVLDSANTVEPISVMELHCRLGHIAVSSAQKLVESGAIVGVDLDPSSEGGDCNVCIFACATCLLVPKLQISLPAQNFRDEVHTDVWGPTTIVMRQGRQYFIMFMDDATCYTITFLLCTKYEALEAYKSYKAWVTMQQHCKAIKVLHSDRGGEYLSTAFD